MKKIMYILIIIIILFIIGIIGVFFFKDSSQDCKRLGTLMEQDNCYMRNAGIKQDFKICNNIQNTQVKANCYNSISETKDKLRWA